MSFKSFLAYASAFAFFYSVLSRIRDNEEKSWSKETIMVETQSFIIQINCKNLLFLSRQI